RRSQGDAVGSAFHEAREGVAAVERRAEQRRLRRRTRALLGGLGRWREKLRRWPARGLGDLCLEQWRGLLLGEAGAPGPRGATHQDLDLENIGVLFLKKRSHEIEIPIVD